MHQGHRTDPIPAFREQLRYRRVLDAGSLEAEQAADQLQVVLDPVVHLSEQGLLLLGRGLHLLFGLLHVVDINVVSVPTENVAGAVG